MVSGERDPQRAAVLSSETPAFTDAEVRAAIGPRADYYLDAWSGRDRRFNWAAFFTSMLWLSHRKMYRLTAVLGAMVVAESLVEEAVFVAWLGAPMVPRWMDTLSGLVIACVCARFGNDWYRVHVERLVASARAAEPDEEARLRLLARKGGRSIWAAVVALLAFFFAMAVAMVCFEVLVSLVDSLGADRQAERWATRILCT